MMTESRAGNLFRLCLACLALGCLLVLACECGDEECTIDEEVGCSSAQSLQMPDWVAAGESIGVFVSGVVGPDTCYHLERVELEWTGSLCVVRPVAHHVAAGRGVCGGSPVYFSETVRLFRGDSGWVRVELETDGPVLADSAFVRGQPAQVDTLDYTGYISSMMPPVVVGWFTLRWPESGVVTGEWHFSYQGTPYDVGPQIGDGNLWGRTAGARIEIALSPGCRDNCVSLDGEFVGDRYAGVWEYTTARGSGGGGPFEALRR